MQLSLTENGGCKSGSAAISGPSVCESFDALAASLHGAVSTFSSVQSSRQMSNGILRRHAQQFCFNRTSYLTNCVSLQMAT